MNKNKYFQQKKVLLAISGGIAVYKACLLLRELQKAGATVRVAMTKSATEFVGVETFKALTHHEVFTEVFGGEGFPHIDYPHWADMLVVAPTTANTMAKFAHGLADDPVSLAFLVCEGPKLVIPAMNPSMYEAPATQANMEILRNRGVGIMEAEEGTVACGDTGRGKFPDTDAIMQWMRDSLRLKELPSLGLKGKRVLITAGRTEEAIDPVRSIVNKSSGKTAVAIADAFYYAGAEVCFVHGPMDVAPPSYAEVVGVQSAVEMHDAVMARIEAMDMAVMNAAVADFRPKKLFDKKIKASHEMLNIELEANPNILQSVGQLGDKRPEVLVGFALETDNVLEHAQAKLAKSPCDILVLNMPVSADSGFGFDAVECTLVKAGVAQTKPPEMLSKSQLAADIVKACQEVVHGS